VSKSRPLKLFETRKLFYTEYLFKLVLRNELNTIFRTELQKKEKLSYARSQLDQLTESYRNNLPLVKKFYRSNVIIDVQDYFDAMIIFTTLKNSEEYKLRIDPSSQLTLFSNNKQFLLDLASKVHTTTVQFWQPNPTHIELLKSETRIILVDSIPELSLKVHFNSKRVPKEFAKWIRSNGDKCRMGEIAIDSLENYGYLNGLYMYVRDEKVLNLITLLAGRSIRSIEKLVYASNIDK
jgi:hypothetical protein